MRRVFLPPCYPLAAHWLIQNTMDARCIALPAWVWGSLERRGLVITSDLVVMKATSPGARRTASTGLHPPSRWSGQDYRVPASGAVEHRDPRRSSIAPPAAIRDEGIGRLLAPNTRVNNTGIVGHAESIVPRGDPSRRNRYGDCRTSRRHVSSEMI